MFAQLAEYRRSYAAVTMTVTQDPLHTRDEPSAEFVYRRSTTAERFAFEEFKTIALLGRGTFAKVYLVYLLQNDVLSDDVQLYALKSMRKDFILASNSLQSVELEKMILL